MKTRRTARRGGTQRRAVVAVQMAVGTLVFLAFAAITVDLGAIHNAKLDLQRSVDAAALAAAAKLADFSTGDPVPLARAAAITYAEANHVLGQTVTLDPNVDIVFGRASYDADTNTYVITPTETLPDAVSVQIRLTEDSPNEARTLFFASIFGRTTTDMTVVATALMVPRDIAVVADLSGSHNDDSELRHYDVTEINLLEVWGAMPIERGNNGVGNGIDPPPPGNPNNPNDPPGAGPGSPGNQGGNGDPGADPMGGQMGPTWGWLYWWGNELDGTYDPVDDPAMIYLPHNVQWTNPGNPADPNFAEWLDLRTWYEQVGYSAEEVNALMTAGFDDAVDGGGERGWTNRVAVALGFARWDSMIPGGLWETIPPGHRNNTDGGSDMTWVEAAELSWLVDYPYEDAGSWSDFTWNYVRLSDTRMAQANPDFRYRFGVKTYVNYLLEKYPSYEQVPDFAETPTQPMQAVKDAVTMLTGLLEDWGTDDRLSLEIYGTIGRHEVDLTTDYASVSDRLNEMQAGHYDVWTNMGAGIQQAIDELSSVDRARSTSRKTIFLLTDGNANVNESGEVNDEPGGAAYALAKAQEAADLGMVIYTISVGSGSNQSLMQQIADIGLGEHFHAEGSIDNYSAELLDIFMRLGGTRPVELIR